VRMVFLNICVYIQQIIEAKIFVNLKFYFQFLNLNFWKNFLLIFVKIIFDFLLFSICSYFSVRPFFQFTLNVENLYLILRVAYIKDKLFKQLLYPIVNHQVT